MASLCIVGMQSLDTEERSRLLELLKEGHAVVQIERTYYLFEDCSEVHAQCAEFFARIEGKDCKKSQAVRDGGFISLGKEIDLNINSLINDEQSAKSEGKGLSDLIWIISDALSTKCEAITPIISISSDIQLRLCLSFTSPAQMAQFIQGIYDTRLWGALEKSRQRQQPGVQIEAEDLHNLKSLIDSLKRRQLGFIKTNPYLTSKLSQGNYQYWGADLAEINDKLLNEDVLSIKSFWDCGLPSFLHSLQQNWTIFRLCYEQQLTKFVVLNLKRSSKLVTKECLSAHRRQRSIDLYQTIYPGMKYLLQRFRVLLGINVIQEKKEDLDVMIKGKTSTGNKEVITTSSKSKDLMKGLQIEEIITDRLFHFFLDQQRKEAGYKTSIDIHVLNRETVKLKEVIGHCLQFYRGMSRWTDLFSTVSHYFRSEYNQETIKPSQEQNHFLQNIESQPLQNAQCLGCSQFFYTRSNIYDESANKSSVRVFPSIRRLREDEAAVKDEICGMLNSGGGIILFDCERSYRSILALGQKISEKEKEEYQQRIQSYLRHFYPKIDLDSQVSISFVPLVNPYGHKGSKETYTGKAGYLKQNYIYEKHRYIDSMFATRIKVVSLDPSLVYFWQVKPTLQNKEIEYRRYCQVASQSGETSLLSSRGMLKLIKRRMRQFYIPEKYSQEDKRQLKNTASLLNHDCDFPDIGAISLTKNHPQHQKKSSTTNQQKYGEMCLIVTKRKNFPKVEQFLNSSGIACEISYHFETYRFAKVANTGVVYHNSKFQDIAREVSRPAYKVSNRSPLVINVTPYLKLEKRNDNYPLSEQDFRSFSKAFFKEFPNEFIKAFMFIGDTSERQYYLTTKSKLSTVFMYFYLDNFNQTTKLKNPPRLDKLSEEERAARFVLLFSSANGKAN